MAYGERGQRWWSGFKGEFQLLQPQEVIKFEATIRHQRAVGRPSRVRVTAKGGQPPYAFRIIGVPLRRPAGSQGTENADRPTRTELGHPKDIAG